MMMTMMMTATRGGKPSKGTKKDRRLTQNKPSKDTKKGK